jgi:hypothetical protein
MAAGRFTRPVTANTATHHLLFVGEATCVNCLKCALHANRTFGIKPTHGHTLVVDHWPTSEDAIWYHIHSAPPPLLCISPVINLDGVLQLFFDFFMPTMIDLISSGHVGVSI